MTATDSPLLDIGLLSPSLSFSGGKASSLNTSNSYGSLFDAGIDSGNDLVDDLLILSSPQIPFAFTSWGWNTSSGRTIVDFTRNHTRSDSLVADNGDGTPFEEYLPQIPQTIPEILPSLYFETDAGEDEEDDAEDELTETYSGFIFDDTRFDEVHISTFHSLTTRRSETMIRLPMEENDSPDVFGEIDAIIAAVRMADGNSTETI